jgi:outer membrane protein assembly factor BamE (lipoprotein component of BamABCDE complex)
MKTRTIVALSLVVLGLGLLSGCVFIPTFNKTTEGINVAKQIGDQNSRKPVRVGFTREQVTEELGPPQYATDDMRKIAYQWRVLQGVWILPLCFAAPKQEEYRVLVLSFNDAGTFEKYEMRKDNSQTLMPWYHPIRPPVPEQLKPYRSTTKAVNN